MRTHTDENPQQCEEWYHSAAQISRLHQHHLLKHTGDKPYMHGECGYRTTQTSHLSTHMRTHTAEKPYKCDQCDYSAAQRASLTRHLATHIGKKVSKFNCGHCDYSTTRKSYLDDHLREHTLEKPYMCDSSGYRAASRNELSAHIKTHIA